MSRKSCLPDQGWETCAYLSKSTWVVLRRGHFWLRRFRPLFSSELPIVLPALKMQGSISIFCSIWRRRQQGDRCPNTWKKTRLQDWGRLYVIFTICAQFPVFVFLLSSVQICLSLRPVWLPGDHRRLLSSLRRRFACSSVK